MILNYSDIFRQNMMNNAPSNILAMAAVPEYNSVLNPDEGNVKPLIDNNNILDLIRRRKYDRAIKLIKANKINAFSLFNNVNVFGNKYDSIPFIAAALALSLEKSKNTESMYEKFNKVISELIIPAGLNASNMFDARFTSPNGCNDVLSFILTHDGQIKPKDYDEDSDIDVLVLLNSILDEGYSLDNHDGIVRYVIGNDLISSLKKLVEKGIYKLNIDDIKNYSIPPMSNIGKYISFAAPHPFRFHSPEIEYDDKGKFSGGSLYFPLKNIGYDISNPEKEFKVHISIPFMLKDYIENAYGNYLANGENFTNDSDVNLGEGSEFLDAVNMLKRVSGEYGKYLKSPETQHLDEGERIQRVRDMVKSSNENLFRMQNGINTILANIGFPKMILEMHNPLDANDRKILYKASPFMKEIWNSVKLLK